MTALPNDEPPPFEPRLRAVQRQVIADRYLRDAPSVGAWLWGVAHNLALAEALYAEGLERLEARLAGLDTVRVVRSRSAAGESAMVLTLGEPGRCGADPDAERARFDRFLARLAQLARTEPARTRVRYWRRRFYERMARWELLPNSPTLMNAGRPLQQLSACFVLPVPDHLEGIMYALRAQALIHKSGGGTGFSFGRLRPAGDPVGSTRGAASGPLDFMRAFDCMTDVIKQGGTRRGANMGILAAEHPDIERFIDAKRQPGTLVNFNLSVGASDRFMEAVRARARWALVHPRTGEVVRRVRADRLFESIAQAAWACGDPGLVFLDRLNEAGSNPTPALGRVESTNPCGEVGMLPFEPCNLASLNLAAFCEGEIGAARLDTERLAEAVHDAIRLLDDVIEVNRFPLPEIERMAKRVRRVGLGVMGWAEALVRLGIPYDAPEAIERAEALMALIAEEALRASERVAEERGVFPTRKAPTSPAAPHAPAMRRAPASPPPARSRSPRGCTAPASSRCSAASTSATPRPPSTRFAPANARRHRRSTARCSRCFARCSNERGLAHSTIRRGSNASPPCPTSTRSRARAGCRCTSRACLPPLTRSRTGCTCGCRPPSNATPTTPSARRSTCPTMRASPRCETRCCKPTHSVARG